MILVILATLFTVFSGTAGQHLYFDKIVEFNRTSENNSHLNWTSRGTVVLTSGDLVGFEPKLVIRVSQDLCTVNLTDCPSHEARSSATSCYCTRREDDKYSIQVGGRVSRSQSGMALEAVVPGQGPLANIFGAVSIGVVPGTTGPVEPVAASCPCPNSLVETNDVTIVSSPPAILVGVTRHLAVNCSFLAGSDSDLSSIMSLIISKTDGHGSNTFTEIATITLFGKVKIKDSRLGATVTGHFSQQDNAAFLALEWADPSGQAVGSYRCQAYGMDIDGHPRVSFNVTSVLAAKENIEELVEYVKWLYKTEDEYKANVTEILVEATSYYNGHKYILSVPSPRNLENSLKICHFWGGYLVEINDQNEHDFVKNFASVNNSVVELALGAWDEGHEGKWTYIRTEKPVEFSNKEDGNGGSTANCLVIHKGRVIDEPCNGKGNWGDQIYQFLCEIPHWN